MVGLKVQKPKVNCAFKKLLSKKSMVFYLTFFCMWNENKCFIFVCRNNFIFCFVYLPFLLSGNLGAPRRSGVVRSPGLTRLKILFKQNYYFLIRKWHLENDNWELKHKSLSNRQGFNVKKKIFEEAKNTEKQQMIPKKRTSVIEWRFRLSPVN